MPTDIPIRNVYYLLCYAWNRLDQGQLVDVNRIPSTELVDLFAFVLCEGVHHLSRRGMEQNYQLREEELSSVRGRLDLTESIRRASFVHGRAYCRYDDLTTDTLANRIIKGTLIGLRKAEGLDTKLRDRVHTTAQNLRTVTSVKVSKRHFKQVRVSSNGRLYRFVLSVCELINDSLLVDEAAGTTRFRDFTRDEAKMARLFQSFLYNFILRECPQWSVKSENIAWKASSETDPQLNLLPRMQTDISLTKPGKYLIIDAKYYRQALSSHFDTDKVRSENLYQLMTYLMNADRREGASADGMLIYPKVDRELRDVYNLIGRKVSVCTVDLGAAWQSIDQEIRALVS